MKKLLASLVAVGALALAAPVHAADMPMKAPMAAPVMAVPFSWSGFYLGAHVGGGWADESWCRDGSGVDGCAVRVPGANYANVDPSGFLGGLQAGFNWQTGQFVFGVEGQISGADINGSDNFRTFNSTYVAHTDINAIATLAARFGIAFDRTLLYAKGGGAWTDEDHWIVNTTAGTTFGKTNVNRTGWVAGAGVEQALGDAWSAKLEYNYMDLGSGDVTIAGAGGQGATSVVTIDRTIQTVTFGINYRFGGR